MCDNAKIKVSFHPVIYQNRHWPWHVSIPAWWTSRRDFFFWQLCYCACCSCLNPFYFLFVLYVLILFFYITQNGQTAGFTNKPPLYNTGRNQWFVEFVGMKKNGISGNILPGSPTLPLIYLSIYKWLMTMSFSCILLTPLSFQTQIQNKILI